MFVGRHKELQRLDELLRDPRGQAILVLGQQGMGNPYGNLGLIFRTRRCLPEADVGVASLREPFRVQVSGTEIYHSTPAKNMYSHPVEAGEYGMVGAGEGYNIIHPADPPRNPQPDIQYDELDY